MLKRKECVLHQRRGCVACSAKAGRAAVYKPEERPAERPVREVAEDVGRLALERRIMELTSTVKIPCTSQWVRFSPLGLFGPRSHFPGVDSGGGSCVRDLSHLSSARWTNSTRSPEACTSHPGGAGGARRGRPSEADGGHGAGTSNSPQSPTLPHSG